MSGRDVPIDDLLIHADFVRSLARDLVGDAAAADDLAQEAWVRALESPPHHGAALRGWFATLLANLLSNRRRAERRRRAREQAVAALPPPAVPTPERILEREHARERLVCAVLRLDEPFRTAVLLRYYEEVPTPEIARRLGVPAATVRTRLARGMQRLRELLDDDHAGRRDAWVLAFTGFLVRPAPAVAVRTGILAMKKLAIALAAAVVLTLTIALAMREDVAPPEAETAAKAAVGAGATLDPQAPVRAGERTVADGGYDARAVQAMPADRGVGSVFGELVGVRAEAAANLLVEAVPVTGTLPPRMQLRDDRAAASARSDGAGAFHIDGVPAGPTRVQTTLADGRVASATVIVARDTAEGPAYLRVDSARQDPGDAVTVRVVDGDGHRLAAAEVELFAWSVRNEVGNRLDDPRREALARARTRDDGTVRFDGLGVRSGFAFAWRDGAVGQAYFDLGMGGSLRELVLDVVLRPGAGLRGELVGADPARLRDAVLTLHAVRREGIQWGGSRAFDAPVKGREFAFSDLPPGLYGVTLRAPGGARLVVPTIGDGPHAIDNSARMRVVGLERGKVAEAQFEVALAPRLRGRVTQGGAPVGGARVRAVLAPRTSNDTAGVVVRGVHVWRFDQAWENCLPDPLTHVDTITDRDGRYEFTSLQPGRHRVEVVANGLSYDRRMDVALADGETVDLVHELVPAGALQVAGLGLGLVGVLAPGSQDPEMIAVIQGEHVTFPGLRPGRWQVARCHYDSRVAPVVVGEAEVVAGRTTWLDLRAATVAAVVHGVVTSGGAPVTGAGVELWPAETRTDAFGAFRMVFGDPVRVGRGTFGRALRIGKGGVVHDWFTASADPQAELECAIDLGARRLRVRVVDEQGLPVAANLRLDGVLPHEGPGVDRVGIDTGVPAGGREFGPLPACELRGSVTFADDLSIPVAIPADATEWRIERVVTTPLVVVVRDGQGRGLPGRNVVAWRWTGAGPAPDDPKLFTGTVEVHSGKTGDDGVLRLLVPPGEYAVYASAFLSQTEPVRVLLALGATSTVELEMK